jgi:predicted CXXCH cytochrome family protein
MKTKRTAFLVSALTVSLVVFSGTAWSLSILFPPEESYVDNGAIHLILKNDQKKVDAYQVTVNKFGYPKVDIPGDKEYFYPEIFLASGMNKVIVTGYRGKEKISTNELDIFFRDKLSKENNHAPRGTERYLFHTPENEKLCSTCHRMDVTLNDINPTSPEDSPCYTCHKGKLNTKYVHNPAGKWTCLQCHLTRKDSRKYEVGKPTMDVCYTCHGIKIKGWSEQNVMHGPTAVGQCELCHNPHGSDWPSLVRMHASDLCLRCHTDKASGKHVIAGFYGKGHPTRGVPDPRDPSKEFTCASCHNPHGAETNGLLNYPRPRGGMSFCRNCHKK